MRQIAKNIIITIVLIFLSLILFVWTLGTLETLILFGGLRPKTTIHKVMNHNQYNIVVVSRASFTRILPNGHIYLEVWSNNKKINSYPLSHTDEIFEYNDRIKDIILLPDSNEIKVEFPDGGVSRIYRME